MRRITPLLLIVATSAFAQTELDRVAAATANTRAAFTHRFTPKGFKSGQTESGTVTFGALPAMRWSYTRPEEKLFVFDGKRSWFYVPGDKQVTIADVDDRRRSELPFLLLGDRAAREKLFKVSERKDRGKIVVRLESKNRAAAVRGVDITVDPATHRMQRVAYSDRDGNHTVFEFSGYDRSTAGADAFRFAPPEGVQIIRSE